MQGPLLVDAMIHGVSALVYLDNHHVKEHKAHEFVALEKKL